MLRTDETVRPATRSVSPDILLVIAFAAVDGMAMLAASLLGHWFAERHNGHFSEHVSTGAFTAIAIAALPFWISLFAFTGIYRVRQHSPWTTTVMRVVVAIACGVMLLVVVDYLRLSSPLFISRAVPVYILVFGIVLALAGRGAVRLALRVAYAHGRGRRSVVVIGTGPVAAKLVEDLTRRGRGYAVEALVDPLYDGAISQYGIPVYRSVAEALDRVAGPVDEILQADDSLGRDEVAELVAFATSRGMVYRFVPDRYGVYAAASSMTTIDGVPVMQVSLTSLGGWGAVGKRALDVAGSALLIVLLSPVFLAVGLAVKLSDPQGPVFYRQERIGRGGVPIRIAKFRTMRWAYSTGADRPYRTAEEAFTAMGRSDLVAEFAEHQKVADDPRVSPLGRLLRKSSLDELPQLFAALRGELSLIGPRPITPMELERYGVQRASFLALKPGITGLWQVSGRSDTSYDERIQLDIFYIENWSLRLDLSILARTTTAVLAKRGAY